MGCIITARWFNRLSPQLVQLRRLRNTRDLGRSRSPHPPATFQPGCDLYLLLCPCSHFPEHQAHGTVAQTGTRTRGKNKAGAYRQYPVHYGAELLHFWGEVEGINHRPVSWISDLPSRVLRCRATSVLRGFRLRGLSSFSRLR